MDLYRFILPLLLSMVPSLTTGANAATLFVTPTGTGDGSSWSAPFGSLQAAVDAAFPGDQVWIAQGVYNATVEMATGVALYGGFVGDESDLNERDWRTHQSIIDAAGLGARGIQAVDVENFILDGLVVQNGRPSDNLQIGGGILLQNVDSATISHCLVHECYARDGGGMACRYASPTIFACSFTHNSALVGGGGFYSDFGIPTLERCWISNNRSQDGGGMRLFVSNAVVRNCTITRNESNNEGGGATLASSEATLIDCAIFENFGPFGGGFLFTSPGSQLIGCKIYSNLAYSGGAYYGPNAQPVFTRCLIYDNLAMAQGGVAYLGSPTFYNCTIVGNWCYDSAAGFAYSAKSVFRNCIIWNHGREFVGFGVVDSMHSCFRETSIGQGNIAQYPLFRDPSSGDWSLSNSSPCIDSGADIGAPFNGTSPDMGAVEAPGTFVNGTTFRSATTLYVRPSAPSGGDGFSWKHAFPSIRTSLLASVAGDRIWVASGVYKEFVPLTHKVSLLGGFGGYETDRGDRNVDFWKATIDVSGLGDHLPCVSAANSFSATLDGFTLTGAANFEIGGGGLRVFNSANLRIANCRISGNQGVNGGAILMQDSEVDFWNCDIIGNHAEENGGAFHVVQSEVRCINTIIAWNSAERSALGDVLASSFDFENCTLAYNFSNRGNVFNVFSSLGTQIQNSIYWENASVMSQIMANPFESATYTLFQGVFPGEGNLNTDPLFVAANESDFRLQITSSAIDAGNPDPRFNDLCLPPGQGTDRNDMGVYGGPYNCARLESDPPDPTPTRIPFTPSDLDPDGTVDSIDLLRLLKAWKSEVENASPEDLFTDGMIDVKDLSLFQQHWYETTGP